MILCFLKKVENIVLKGEIAHNEHFLLLNFTYSKVVDIADVSKCMCVGKGKESFTLKTYEVRNVIDGIAVGYKVP